MLPSVDMYFSLPSPWFALTIQSTNIEIYKRNRSGVKIQKLWCGILIEYTSKRVDYVMH